jgi:hypothetical protein
MAVTAFEATLSRVEAELDRLKQERRWIPVSEQLPKVEEEVLLLFIG